MTRTSRCDRTRWSVLAVCALLVGAREPAPGQSRMPTEGQEPRVEYDYHRGVDMSQFLPVHGEAICDLKRCKNSAAEREETKDEAYRTAFERIDQMGRTYSLARRHYLEGFHRLTDANDSSILREDVRFLKATEIYDHKHGEYKYTVDLAVRRVPQLDPQLETSLHEFLQRNPPQPKDGEIVFDLTDMLGKLEKDEQFRIQLERIRKDQRFQSSLRYKDDDTQRFLTPASEMEVKIQGYPPGQYSVNALIGSIIERSVALAVQRLLQDYQNVKVICEGATDRLKISNRIEYSGEGRKTQQGKLILFGSAEGTPLQEGLRDNLALSFARGHEGIRALAQILGPRLRSGRIDLYYTGRGEVASGQGNHPESRRIKFRVVLGPKIR